jgi:hypothetical protein
MLSNKVEAITKSKWRSSRKELSDGSRLISYAPEIEGSEIRSPPAIKNTSDLKVRKNPLQIDAIEERDLDILCSLKRSSSLRLRD